jgi:hypothetical protein
MRAHSYRGTQIRHHCRRTSYHPERSALYRSYFTAPTLRADCEIRRNLANGNFAVRCVQFHRCSNAEYIEMAGHRKISIQNRTEQTVVNALIQPRLYIEKRAGNPASGYTKNISSSSRRSIVWEVLTDFELHNFDLIALATHLSNRLQQSNCYVQLNCPAAITKRK